jgi:hypothetical protein
VLALLLLLQSAAGGVVEGKGSTTAEIPRLEASVLVDGVLDDPVWSQAIRLNRALFFRAIGKYRSERRAALLEPGTGDSLFVGGAAQPAIRTNGLRVDLLASFEPTPGTVAFLGTAACWRPTETSTGPGWNG